MRQTKYVRVRATGRGSRPIAFLLFTFFLMAPVSAVAEESVLGGIFLGNEAKMANQTKACDQSPQLPYQQVLFQVSATGSYNVSDAFHSNGVNVIALVYKDSFNPANPQANLAFANPIDISLNVNLTVGTNYYLVVQSWCFEPEGAWSVAIHGPGNVTSGSLRNVPAFTKGTFSTTDPKLSGPCGNTFYKQTGPLRVAVNGTYYFQDISRNFDVDTCVLIYTAPVDLSDASKNRIVAFDNVGTVRLETGKDYYFVVQPLSAAQDRTFFFVLAPPAPFRINQAMGGSWYDPATAGQGFLLDVFDNINKAFLAWFTYDLERPDPSVQADIGDPGHRWMTAFGSFSETSADLDIEWTVGGVFDSGQPAPTQTVDGSVLLEFTDCLTGTATYDLGNGNGSGVIPIQRVANDGVTLCEALNRAPAMPGPL